PRAPHGLVLVVLLRTACNRARRARQFGQDRQGYSELEIRPDRRRLSAGHGRLARDRQGLRRRRARRPKTDTAARVRAGHLGGAVYRRGGFALVPAASGLVYEARRRHAAALGRSDLRRLAPWALVRARRNASRGAEASREPVPYHAPRMGLHVFQARR